MAQHQWPSTIHKFRGLTRQQRHNVRGVLQEAAGLGEQLAHPAAVVGGADVADADAAVGVREAEERDAAALVAGVRPGKAVRGAVGRRPEALVEGLVGVADQSGVRVGVLHQGGGGGELQRGWK